LFEGLIKDLEFRRIETNGWS